MIDAARTALTRERPLRGRGFLVAAVVVGAGSAVAIAMPEGAAARWLLAGVLAAVLAFVCLRSTRQGVLLAFVWLLFVGLSRRLASEVLADPSKDPLLLVVLGAARGARAAARCSPARCVASPSSATRCWRSPRSRSSRCSTPTNPRASRASPDS